MNTFFVELNGVRSSRKKVAANDFGERFYRGFSYLKRHCYEPIGIEDLAKASKMSKRGLHNAFSKYLGQTPGRELRRLRIERAKNLLINSNHDQKAVAALCGFRSVNSFWVSFREAVGESPGKFRFRFGKKAIAKEGQESSRGKRSRLVKFDV